MGHELIDPAHLPGRRRVDAGSGIRGRRITVRLHAHRASRCQQRVLERLVGNARPVEVACDLEQCYRSHALEAASDSLVHACAAGNVH